MDLLDNARQKLEATLDVLKKSKDYAIDIKAVLAALDDGLQFTKQHYGELNSITLAKTHNLKGSDIYFFFMRFTHQFYNVLNVIQTKPNAGYYEKFLFLLEVRQQRFDELKEEALAKGQEILI
jgi:hypothetical protein